ncbi:membrane-spanning 4-domains subfamily A member 5-like [Pholidichthys leucotaenia]
MSVTVSKADGVTVLTLTTDPQSPWPPLCQIIKNLCYSPVCCSVSENLRKVQSRSQTVLGTLQVLVGLMNIGLGTILLCSGGGSSWQMDETLFPVWLGILFIIFGVMSILSERYPSPCMVVLSVVLNMAGVIFAIAAIVLYTINMLDIYVWNFCSNDDDYYYYSRHTTPGVTNDLISQGKCQEAIATIWMLLRGINAVLIVLSVLEFCVAISSAVLGIKALRSREDRKEKTTEDPESIRPLLEDATTAPTA